MAKIQGLTKWLTPGIGVKRWALLILVGILLVSIGLVHGVLLFLDMHIISGLVPFTEWMLCIALILLGLDVVGIAVYKLSHSILAPYRKHQQGRVVDVVYAYNVRQKGLKVVAIGGGTGLPSVLRGLKQFTSNITAVVTVADDGGSSGRLRRELGILPPGDLRNNIAALADDESLMTHLFQYRFDSGDLGGHSFGNLFISALAGVTGSTEAALIETERVLNIQGRVLPATLEDVHLVATVYVDGSPPRTITIHGESDITHAGGRIEQIGLNPPDVQGYGESIQSILDADVVVIGPGSLFTSILPNLLVRGVTEALRATNAYILYVCNVAMQPGETDGFSVADHILALEKHIGRGMFQLVLANNVYPTLNAGSNTRYVLPAPDRHEVLQRYEIRYTDLTDSEQPWRHDPQKLVRAILTAQEEERAGTGNKFALTEV
jgi:uncharacterized cofD-like protein